ncbi:MAG: VWA domain-containing protein [Dehalococcoidia bacterium]|nr:VWA domain-containing protein [Dehalococcoidia bacterium]
MNLNWLASLGDLKFSTCWALLLLVPLVGAAASMVLAPIPRGSLAVAEASPALAAAQRHTIRMRLRWLPPTLRFLAIALLIVALTRPRQGLALSTIPEEGIDLVVALDVSSSMSERVLGATDSKLVAAQRAVVDFVRKLEGDRIGLVIFQSRALTMSPLTVDQDAIASAVRNTRSGLLPDGTAIGLGLAGSLNLLRESPARSRVVVLLTDGQNNTGEITPAAAAALARALEVRVYAIGFVAGRDTAVDAAALTAIAESTQGRYFDASTAADLTAAYDEIAGLERSVVGERRFTRYREFAPALAIAALVLLVLESALRSTWLRRHP